MRARAIAPLLLLVLAACSSATVDVADDEGSTSTAGAPSTSTADNEACAHVIDATVEATGDGVFRVSATVASQETGLDKYADRWEIRDPATGAVIGERILAHPHVNEQPFTRSLPGVEISADVPVVEIAAHDSVLGFCGDVFNAGVPQP